MQKKNLANELHRSRLLASLPRWNETCYNACLTSEPGTFFFSCEFFLNITASLVSLRFVLPWISFSIGDYNNRNPLEDCMHLFLDFYYILRRKQILLFKEFVRICRFQMSRENVLRYAYWNYSCGDSQTCHSTNLTCEMHYRSPSLSLFLVLKVGWR